jgi:hypothetical protein
MKVFIFHSAGVEESFSVCEIGNAYICLKFGAIALAVQWIEWRK